MVNFRLLRAFSYLLLLTTMISVSSCEGDNTPRTNPLLVESWDNPHNIIPYDKILATDYMPAMEVAISEQDAIIEAITSDTLKLTFESVILRLDNSDTKITDIFNIFSMIEASASTPEMAKVSEDMMPRLSAQQDIVLHNSELFERVKTIYDARKTSKLNREQIRLTERTYNKFVREGALLDEEAKQRLAEINETIALLRVKFSQNLLAENNNFVMELHREQMDGITGTARANALQEANNRGLENSWVITLKPSSLIPFLTYSKKRELREELYKAYINRGKNGNEFDNREIVVEVTRLRQEKAKILGHNNYAEYVTSQQMAGTPKAAYELLEEVWTPALKIAKEEKVALERNMRSNNANKEDTLEAWDWWFYTDIIREKKFHTKWDMLRNYFPVEGVRNGAFLLANRLYGLTFRPIIIAQYEDLCSAYEVVDVDGKILGVLHLDLYTRDTKGQGAWCGFLREQRYDNGQRVAPIVSISCNFNTPEPNKKTLLDMREIETLFHEFGHALHFLFQDVKYRGLSEVEGDFVELPSQIMENWAFRPELLRLYAVNNNNGEVLSDAHIQNIVRSMTFNQGFSTLEVTAAALMDLDLHTLDSLDGFDVNEFEIASLRDKRGLISQISPRYYLPQFSHLFTFDYASGYYFYMWAEVLDKDAFESFTSSGDIFNRTIANKFRREILERGGSEDGEVMYRNFKGAAPSREPLLLSRGLIEPPKIEEDTPDTKEENDAKETPNAEENSDTKKNPKSIVPSKDEISEADTVVTNRVKNNETK